MRTWSRRSRATLSSRCRAAEWRNSRLDFSSLHGLMRSLAAPPPAPGFELSAEALDETTLRQLANRRDRRRRAPRPRQSRAAVGRLPDPGLPQDDAGRAHAPHRGPVRAPDPGRPAHPRGLDRRASSPRSTAPTATSTPCRRASPASAPWPMSPTAPTGSPIPRLAGPRPRSGGPALRHPAREADAALRRPAHQRADALAAPACRADPGGVGADGAVTVEGHVVGRLTGRAFRAGARRLGAGKPRACGARSSAPSRRRSRGGSASWRASPTRPSR